MVLQQHKETRVNQTTIFKIISEYKQEYIR